MRRRRFGVAEWHRLTVNRYLTGERVPNHQVGVGMLLPTMRKKPRSLLRVWRAAAEGKIPHFIIKIARWRR